MSFAIVVDSVADLSEEECARFGITSVPLSVEVGGETFKDQAEISSEEFYDKMIASDTLPKSSQPSPSEFMDIYNALASEGADEIIDPYRCGAFGNERIIQFSCKPGRGAGRGHRLVQCLFGPRSACPARM